MNVIPTLQGKVTAECECPSWVKLNIQKLSREAAVLKLPAEDTVLGALI